ncbi:hypothetical protein [Streptomyces zingiberis]|uniref:23S rRNA (Guanosine(2251)-2'-O)-methyltransferase RlmB n=1 Tax=Streptomyces zingiberis TaxID=2053010 RepID=A0ABX1C656_9ACTN|nr:hypothetical protein [Streptomyces zingiberis]NJQ02419.1 hypothetical protein [Streptomyces zingiberis]
MAKNKNRKQKARAAGQADSAAPETSPGTRRGEAALAPEPPEPTARKHRRFGHN